MEKQCFSFNVGSASWNL